MLPLAFTVPSGEKIKLAVESTVTSSGRTMVKLVTLLADASVIAPEPIVVATVTFEFCDRAITLACRNVSDSLISESRRSERMRDEPKLGTAIAAKTAAIVIATSNSTNENPE